MRLLLKLLVLAAIFCTAAVLFLEGLRLMRIAEAMPAYTDAGAAYELRSASPGYFHDVVGRKAFARDWFAKMHALRTDKWEVYDRGRTMIVLALCVVGAVLLFRLWRDHAIANMETPSRPVLILLGAATYCSVLPPYWLYLLDQQDREYLPWWGDSIGLPGFALLLLVLLTLPILFLVLWLCTRRAELPAQLWDFDAPRPITSIVANLIFGGAVLALAWPLLAEAWYGSPYFIVWNLCMIYLLLCLRAALVAPRQRPAEQKTKDELQDILALS